MMWVDPIVDEVRKAGEELSKQANYDLHTLCENLRKKQNKHGGEIVSFEKNLSR